MGGDFEGGPDGGFFRGSGVRRHGLGGGSVSAHQSTATPEGNRRVQQVADRYLYWLRASRLETHRLGYWWANRMLTTQRPFQEKMTLFWHGHFATTEEKVRDFRKLHVQNELLRRHATGDFRTLMVAVAKDPAMLAFLDAGVNLKGAPNENFAREIMELFTMGVGNYSEQDIKEAARAFTGWNYKGLQYVINPDQHDDGVKTVLKQTGRFHGEQVIDILLAQPVTAEFLAGKLYRYFVREDLSPAYQQRLGKLLRDSQYNIGDFMATVLLSKDFHSPASVATRIKPPVELLISTYKKMELKAVPGIPDFNEQSEMLGQKLFYPPNVAGWANGRSSLPGRSQAGRTAQSSYLRGLRCHPSIQAGVGHDGAADDSAVIARQAAITDQPKG